MPTKAICNFDDSAHQIVICRRTKFPIVIVPNPYMDMPPFSEDLFDKRKEASMLIEDPPFNDVPFRHESEVRI